MDILSFAASAVLLALLLLALDYAKDRGLLTASHQPLANKIIVITRRRRWAGARALALEFARRGAILALWDVRADALRDCVSWLIGECGVPPASVHSSIVDVADAGRDWRRRACAARGARAGARRREQCGGRQRRAAARRERGAAARVVCRQRALAFVDCTRAPSAAAQQQQQQRSWQWRWQQQSWQQRWRRWRWWR